MPEISVIIVNWNGEHFLEVCLAALRRQTFRDFETIFVDNGSSDGSLAYVQMHFPEARILALERNLGFTGGNIAGYELARGNLIVLLNNDTEAHPRWLEEIYKGSLACPEAGSFASKMMYFDDRERIENCGFEVDVAGITMERGRDERDGPEWQLSTSIFGACGGAAAYRRCMLEKIGFLDPDFFMIYEDVDLAFRAQLSGHECVYLPRAIVYHRYRSTIQRRLDLQVYYAQRNIDLVYLKNMPGGLLLRSALRRFLYEAGAALYFLKLGAGAAFFRAKFHVLGQLPLVFTKRRAIRRQRTRSSRELRSIMRASVLSAKWKKLLSRGSEAGGVSPSLNSASGAKG